MTTTEPRTPNGCMLAGLLMTASFLAGMLIMWFIDHVALTVHP